MTQAMMAIEQAVFRIEATSRNASRGVRVALGFAIVAAGYGGDRRGGDASAPGDCMRRVVVDAPAILLAAPPRNECGRF